MSVSLLDVNVLVALFDRDHVHHEAAHGWLVAHRDGGWATCPLTENGLVHVVTHPAYRKEAPAPAAVFEALATFRLSGGHVFWPDDVSLCDRGTLRAGAALTSRQITDSYLLALAVAHRGRLVTMDRSLRLDAVAGASERHLQVLTA